MQQASTSKKHLLQANLQFNALSKLAIFAGPAYSYYVGGDAIPGENYKKEVAPAWNHHFKKGALGWLGWNFGLMVSL